MPSPTVYILQENPEWTAPLEAELQRIGTPFETWNLASGQLRLADAPPNGVFYSRMSASAHTRGNRYAPEYTATVLRWLEQHEAVVLNGTRALTLELSKAAQHLALEACGIRTPQTIVVVGQDQLLRAAAQFDGDFIVKHNRGGKGLGVEKFSGVVELAARLHDCAMDDPAMDKPVDGTYLVQQYIRSPQNFITRCEFIDGEFLYAVKVDASEGFELCPADVCLPQQAVCDVPATATPKFQVIQNFESPLLEAYLRFLKHNEIAVAGIEFIVDASGQAYTYDINTNTNYNAQAESAVGKSGMRQLACALTRRLWSSCQAEPEASLAS